MPGADPRGRQLLVATVASSSASRRSDPTWCQSCAVPSPSTSPPGPTWTKYGEPAIRYSSQAVDDMTTGTATLAVSSRSLEGLSWEVSFVTTRTRGEPGSSASKPLPRPSQNEPQVEQPVDRNARRVPPVAGEAMANLTASPSMVVPVTSNAGVASARAGGSGSL